MINEILDNKMSEVRSEGKKVKLESTTMTSFKDLPSWCFIKSRAMLKGDNKPFVLSVLNSSTETPSKGWKCVLFQTNTNDKGQLWQLVDGHILSQLYGSFVIDIDSDNNNSTDLIINSQIPSNNERQTWKLGSNGEIMNSLTKKFIGIKGSNNGPIDPSNNAQLVCELASSADNVCFQWDLEPSFPLNSILSQTTEPFPNYTDEKLKAYIYISNNLIKGIDDIRSQYTNSDYSFNSFSNELVTMKYPDCAISKENFDEIKTQLQSEFKQVDSIINLFNNYQQFHIGLFADNSARLNQIVSIIQFDDKTTSVAGSILSIISNILKLVLTFLPQPAGNFGNVMMGAISIGTAASTPNKINVDPFKVELSKLWDSLSTNFQAILFNMGTMESMVLKDWGKMKAVYQLLSTSLAWTPTMTSQLISTGSTAYGISLLQMLLPEKYQIYCWNQNFDQKYGFAPGYPAPIPNDIPDYCKWTDENGDLLFIASTSDLRVHPIKEVMDMVWKDNVVVKKDFFRSRNGWSFPTSLVNRITRWLIPNVTNNTSIPMKFTISDFKGDTRTSYQLDLPTFSTSFPLDVSHKNNGHNYYFTITITNALDNSKIATLIIFVSAVGGSFSKGQLGDHSVTKGFLLSDPIFNTSVRDSTSTCNIIVTIDYNDSN
ncbi:hypothetical protein ACTFIZ_006760 [Dictyostelium cf. discoideum]